MDEGKEVKPTKEQITQLWGECGFKFIPRHEYMRFGGPPQKYWATRSHWIYSDGTKHEELPPISPNSLFKYAIPRAIRALQEESRKIAPPLGIPEDIAFRELIELWLAEDPVQFGLETTLFQAIYKLTLPSKEVQP